MKNWFKAVGIVVGIIIFSAILSHWVTAYPVEFGLAVFGICLGYFVYVIKEQFDFEDRIDKMFAERQEKNENSDQIGVE